MLWKCTLKLASITAGWSAPVTAAVLVVFASVLFAVMNGIIRHVAQEVDPLQIVFFRNMFGLLAMMPWLAREGLGVLRSKRPMLIGVRSLIGVLSMSSWFYALSIVALADAVALSFTAPLFGSIVAFMFLGEVIRARRISALVAGFAGMLIILRPGVESVGFGEALVVFSALTMASSIVVMKVLTRTEAVGSLVIYHTLLGTILSIIPAIYVWDWPSLEMWIWVVVLGVVASVAHMAFTRGFAMAETNYLLAFDYVRLPVVALIGWWFFSEPTDLWTWVGALVIAVSSLYLAHREALARRRAKEEISA